MTERRIQRVAGITERVRRVKPVTVLDPHHPVAPGRLDDQVRREAQLGAQPVRSRVCLHRVPRETPIVIADRDHQTATARPKCRQRSLEDRMLVERGGHGPAPASQQLEAVAVQDHHRERLGRSETLSQFLRHQPRCCGRRGRQVKIATDQNARPSRDAHDDPVRNQHRRPGSSRLGPSRSDRVLVVVGRRQTGSGPRCSASVEARRSRVWRASSRMTGVRLSATTARTVSSMWVRMKPTWPR